MRPNSHQGHMPPVRTGQDEKLAFHTIDSASAKMHVNFLIDMTFSFTGG